MQNVQLVVPCYNERSRLRVADFRDFATSHRSVGFVMVNDGSGDDTLLMLRDLCVQHPMSFRCVALPRHVGKAEAVRRGMLEALATPHVRYAGFWDADLATPLDVISTFVRICDENPRVLLVMGARVQLLGRSITRSPLRHYTGRVFATMASAVLSLPVYDTQCGAKLFRASETTRQLFNEPFKSRWIFDVEILARIIRHYGKDSLTNPERLIHEFPLEEWHDNAGSKRKLTDYLTAAHDLFRIQRTYNRPVSLGKIAR